MMLATAAPRQYPVDRGGRALSQTRPLLRRRIAIRAIGRREHMRTYRRQDQLGEVIGHELSDLMRTRMKDPRLGFASITGVELSPDLRHAKVFVSVMGDAEEQRASMKALVSATGFLRHELAQRLSV